MSDSKYDEYFQSKMLKISNAYLLNKGNKMKNLFYIFLGLFGLVISLSFYFDINFIDKLSDILMWKEFNE